MRLKRGTEDSMKESNNIEVVVGGTFYLTVDLDLEDFDSVDDVLEYIEDLESSEELVTDGNFEGLGVVSMIKGNMQCEGNCDFEQYAEDYFSEID